MSNKIAIDSHKRINEAHALVLAWRNKGISVFLDTDGDVCALGQNGSDAPDDVYALAEEYEGELKQVIVSDDEFLRQCAEYHKVIVTKLGFERGSLCAYGIIRMNGVMDWTDIRTSGGREDFLVLLARLVEGTFDTEEAEREGRQALDAGRARFEGERRAS